jgi:hypothetical protein
MTRGCLREGSLRETAEQTAVPGGPELVRSSLPRRRRLNSVEQVTLPQV